METFHGHESDSVNNSYQWKSQFFKLLWRHTCPTKSPNSWWRQRRILGSRVKWRPGLHWIVAWVGVRALPREICGKYLHIWKKALSRPSFKIRTLWRNRINNGKRVYGDRRAICLFIPNHGNVYDNEHSQWGNECVAHGLAPLPIGARTRTCTDKNTDTASWRATCRLPAIRIIFNNQDGVFSYSIFCRNTCLGSLF